MNKDDTDWLKWAGIPENSRDALLADAKIYAVPINYFSASTKYKQGFGYRKINP